MKARSGAAVAASLWVILSAGCPKPAAPSTGPVKRQPPRVTAAKVRRVPTSWSIEAVGSVEAREEVAVAAGAAGVAGKVQFNEGDVVTPDTVLVTIDEERYSLEAKRAEADVTRAQALLDHAEVVWKQRGPLHEQKFISDEEFEEAKAAHTKAVADKTYADAAFALAQKALRDCAVRPPIAGKINSKGVSTGEYVKAESIVATIVDLSELRVRFSVPESESGRLKTDLHVKFEARVAQGKAGEAVVFWVSQVAEAKTRTVECKARLVAPPPDLKPGMSGTVTLALENPTGSLLVPAEAVLPTERGFIVFVVDGKKAKEVKVKPGIQTTTGKVEILEGLKEDDLVIVLGVGALRDGQDVEVKPEEKAEAPK